MFTTPGDRAGRKRTTASGSGFVASVTDNGTGVVVLDNTDPVNPVVDFDGVFVDGVSVTGDGTVGNPLTAPTAAGGDVVGPASAVDGDSVLFDGVTGKLIKDGGPRGNVPLLISTDTVLATNTGLVIPQRLEVAAGVSFEVAGGARVEVTGPVAERPAWVLIEEQTPTGTSVRFSSLGAYTHLELRYVGRGDTSALFVNLQLTFNGDGNNNYDRERCGANATTPTSSEGIAAAFAVVGTIPAGTATANRAGAGTITVYDYRGTTFDKVGTGINAYVQSTASGGTNINMWGFSWRDTSAITSITIALASGNFVTGTKLSLYGIM